MQKLYLPTDELKVEENVYETGINGLWYIERRQFQDERGFFAEVAHKQVIDKLLGKEFVIKQVNHSRSMDNVVRGMHAEDWKKLITITNGVSFCALADVRPESETFTKVVTFKLGYGEGALHGALMVAEGIANSICVLKGPVDYIYCVDRLYEERDPGGDVAISIFDADLKIDWPLEKSQMIISERDKKAVTLREKYPDKF